MMTRDFCYWLNGWLELAQPTSANEEQMKIIQKHLSMVFQHDIDPSFGENTEELRKIHSIDVGELSTEEARAAIQKVQENMRLNTPKEPPRSGGPYHGREPRIMC